MVERYKEQRIRLDDLSRRIAENTEELHNNGAELAAAFQKAVDMRTLSGKQSEN